MTPFAGINRITSNYGYREYRNNKGALICENHYGVDIVPTRKAGEALSTEKWNVRECTGGKVVKIASDNSRGKYVDVQTATGTIERYQHMASICVAVGQAVPQGAVLGVAGATGNVTGAHLHFEVQVNGKPAPPQAWLGLPNVAGTYIGNDTLDNPPAPAKLHTITGSAGMTGGDKVTIDGIARSLGIALTWAEV